MVFNYLLELFYIIFPKLLWMAQFIFVPAWFFQTVSQGLAIPWLVTTFWVTIMAGFFLLGCAFIGQVVLFIKHRGAWQLLSKKTFAILLVCTTVISSATYIAIDSLQYESQNNLMFAEFFQIAWILILCLVALGWGSLFVHGYIFLKWLFGKYFSKSKYNVETYGNALTGQAFWVGIGSLFSFGFTISLVCEIILLESKLKIMIISILIFILKRLLIIMLRNKIIHNEIPYYTFLHNHITTKNLNTPEEVVSAIIEKAIDIYQKLIEECQKV